MPDALQQADRPTTMTLDERPLTLTHPMRIYVCGITPYDVTHLGHASTFVWADVLTRVLRDAGITPIVARNVTDVDDVLTDAARRAGEHADRFAYEQQYDFDRDMAELRVRRPDLEPRARHHVDHVLRLAHTLLDLGVAYEAGGSVFFPGQPVAEGAGFDETEALRLATEYGGRPDDPAKRHPLDAAVWQAAEGRAGEPSWDSPWGPGRPGWHAECAAMVLATFGASVDVHAGGADLAFPHHAFEAAMVEAVTGVAPFARRWLQCPIVGIDGAKMAKSTGNLVLVHDLLTDHPAAVIRLALLDRDWRHDWQWSSSLLDLAAGRLASLRDAAGRPDGTDPPAHLRAVRSALRGDLDVPRALDAAIAAGGPAAALLLDLLGLQ
jgi:cysteinyl-tRNA synthetase